MIEIHLTEQEIQDLNEAIDDPSHSEKTKAAACCLRPRPLILAFRNKPITRDITSMRISSSWGDAKVGELRVV